MLNNNEIIGWRFVDVPEHSGDHGINNPGIHSYTSDRVMSLTREICQNSLDASKGSNLPVKVTFQSYEVNRDDIPGVDFLIEVYKAQIDYFSKHKKNDKSEVDYLRNAIKILSMDKVNCLRISDYNTSGLTQINNELGGNWNNLVKNVGISDKESSAGGSYGIGKHAAIAISNLYLVFYGTITVLGETGFQGVTLLSSFRMENKLFNGKGYYGIKEDFHPINKWGSIDKNHSRLLEETGTDIHIVGVSLESNWIGDIVSAVLDNFLVSILENKLVVNVNQVNITKDNVIEVLEKYGNVNKDSYAMEYSRAYLKAAEYNNIYYLSFFEENDVELRLLFRDEIKNRNISCRRVGMVRKNGMKIFDKDKNPNIDFAGLLILRGHKVNEYFRRLENPQHDKWSTKNTNNEHEKKEAENNRKKLYTFIRETILEIMRKDISDTVNAEGLSDFLYEIDALDGEGRLGETLSKYKFSVIKRNGRLTYKNPVNKAGHSEKDEKTYANPGDGETKILDGNGGGSKTVINPRNIPGVESENGRIALTARIIKPIKLKTFRSSIGYNLFLKLENPVNDLMISMNYLGETGSAQKFKVNNVTSIDKIYIEKNNIRLVADEAKSDFEMIIYVKHNENWSLEVNIYEIQSE